MVVISLMSPTDFISYCPKGREMNCLVLLIKSGVPFSYGPDWSAPPLSGGAENGVSKKWQG